MSPEPALVKGDIFDADVEALVNPVNTVGVMGAGLAAAFKRRYPTNFTAYRQACKRGDVRIGCVFVHDLGMLPRPRYVVNFPTKQHWRDPSQLEYIASGLADLRKQIASYRFSSIAVPPLGCGLGGLKWDQVRPMMINALTGLADTEALIYQP